MPNLTTAHDQPTRMLTVRVVANLAHTELRWTTDGHVTLDLSSAATYAGNMPGVLRWAAGELERNLRPDGSGYLVRRLSLVPTLDEDGGQ